MNIKEIFIRREKLRVIYNATLLVVLIALLVLAFYFEAPGISGVGIFDFTLRILAYAFVANVLYFAGPIGESYLAWLNVNTGIWRVIIFASGLVLSTILEIGVVAAEFTVF